MAASVNLLSSLLIALFLVAPILFTEATIGITFPDNGYVWNVTANSSLTVTWISGDPNNDPKSAKFVLVNPSVYPPADIQLNGDVAISDGKYTVSGVDPAAGSYRFEFQQIGSNRTVLAESGTFNITGGSGNTTASTTSGNGGSSTGTGGTSSTSSSVSHGSSHAAAIGAGVGVPVGLLILAGAGWLLWRKRKAKPSKAAQKEEPGREAREFKAELADHPSKGPGEALRGRDLHEVGAETRPRELGQTEQARELDSAAVRHEMAA